MARPKNSTENMSPAELRACIADMGFSLRGAADYMAIPYRTLQDYALGVVGIPAATAAKVRAHRKEWRQYMAAWKQGLQERLDREFPNGIKP